MTKEIVYLAMTVVPPSLTFMALLAYSPDTPEAQGPVRVHMYMYVCVGVGGGRAVFWVSLFILPPLSPGANQS